MSLSHSIQAGDQIDQYHIEGTVATSGMATVYRAIDSTNGIQVAIKVPHPEIECDPALFERFTREAEIGTRLDHPGVMKVYPTPDRSQVYMAMEWVEGRLLRQILREQPKLPIDRAVKLSIGICKALEYIHTNGVAHRDMKPENIMVNDQDEIKLIDFGIAANAGARRLTFGNFSQGMGTPDYISPEQVRGKRGDARSDLYAMGIMLYEMLTGTVPFTGANPFAVMNDRLINFPPPPSELEPSITPQLQEIIYRALERDPKNRYASAREFAYDLEHQDLVGVANRSELSNWKRRESPPAHRNLLIATFILIPLLILALLVVVARHH